MHWKRNFCFVGLFAWSFWTTPCHGSKDQKEETMLEKSVFHLNKQLEMQYGFAQAVAAGSAIYVSATLPKDTTGSGVYPNAFQMETQIRKVYSDLKVTLNYFGCNFNNIVEENIYTTDMATLTQAMYIRSEFISGDSKMTSTVIQIFSLLDPSAMVAVSVVAEMGDYPQDNVFYLHQSWEQQHGMAHAVLVGDLLRTSSTQSLDDWGNVLYPYDYSSQIKKVYSDLTKTLAHFSLDWSHVISERVYTCNMYTFMHNLDARALVIGNYSHFATSWTEVVQLINPGLVISVSIEAYLGNGKWKTFSIAPRIEQKYHYVQAVSAGPYLRVSGTQSMDGNAVVVALGDMWGQIAKVYADISSTLGALGTDWSQVVREQIYTLDILALGWANGARLNFLQQQTNLTAEWLKTAEMVVPGSLLQVHLAVDLRLTSPSQVILNPQGTQVPQVPQLLPKQNRPQQPSLHFSWEDLILHYWWLVVLASVLLSIMIGTVVILVMRRRGNKTLPNQSPDNRGRVAALTNRNRKIDWTSRRSDASPLTLFRMDQIEQIENSCLPTPVQPRIGELASLLSNGFNPVHGAISINSIISPDLVDDEISHLTSSRVILRHT